MVNCPCTVHTEERGYEWIVFRRQPDRKIGSDGEDEDDVIPVDDVSDDDDFFSAEAEEAILAPVPDDEGTQDNPREYNRDCSRISRTSEKASFSSTDLSDGYKEMAKPQMSKSPHEPSLHSRDKTYSKTQQTD